MTGRAWLLSVYSAEERVKTGRLRWKGQGWGRRRREGQGREVFGYFYDLGSTVLCEFLSSEYHDHSILTAPRIQGLDADAGEDGGLRGILRVQSVEV